MELIGACPGLRVLLPRVVIKETVRLQNERARETSSKRGDGADEIDKRCANLGELEFPVLVFLESFDEHLEELWVGQKRHPEVHCCAPRQIVGAQVRARRSGEVDYHVDVFI